MSSICILFKFMYPMYILDNRHLWEIFPYIYCSFITLPFSFSDKKFEVQFLMSFTDPTFHDALKKSHCHIQDGLGLDIFPVPSQFYFGGLHLNLLFTVKLIFQKVCKTSIQVGCFACGTQLFQHLLFDIISLDSLSNSCFYFYAFFVGSLLCPL